MASTPTMSDHIDLDWCHLCGKRSEHTVDISYSANAEHIKTRSRYIRICASCSDRIGAISRGRSDA